jgi:non-homologous end joining protein Ku
MRREADEVVEQRLAEMRQLADEYGEAAGARAKLEKYLDAKKAALMKEAQKAGHSSVAAQEREALASQEYMDLLDPLEEAVRDAESKKWRLKIFEIGVSIWQTRQANERLEKRAYSNT